MANSYKVLGQANPITSNTNVVLYTVPSGFMAFGSVLSMCNLGSTTGTITVAVCPGGISSAAQTFILYNTYIGNNDSLILTLGLSLATTDQIVVSASTSSFSFVLSGSEVIIDPTVVQSVYNIATNTTVGMIRPDNTSIAVNNGVLSLIPGGSFTLATSSNYGAVRPDNTSILITSGVISANIQIGTTSTLGIVRADGTSILIQNGLIRAGYVATSGITTTSSWTAIQSTTSNNLLFYYGGTLVMSLSTSGAITAANNVTGFGTPG